MSKAQRLARLKEIIRELIKKNLAEVSTTATAGIDGTGTGHYDTPNAFASGSQGGHPNPEVVGYKKVNEDVINEYVSSDNFIKDFNTAMNLVIQQANNLKGPLGKHPIKRNVSKLKAVLNLFMKFIAPTIKKADRDISKGFDLTRIKKDLADGKFKSVLEYQIMNRIGGRSYDSNEFYGIDDKVKKLLDRMHSELRKLVNIMDKAQLESVNEALNDKGVKEFKRELALDVKYVKSLSKLINKKSVGKVTEKDDQLISSLTNLLQGRFSGLANMLKNKSLNEGRYHDWRNDESMTPKQKVGKFNERNQRRIKRIRQNRKDES